MFAEFFNNTISQIILILLSLSSLIGILDHFGLLPRRIKSWIRMNRTTEIMEVLSQLGIDVDYYRRVNQSVSFPSTLDKQEIEKTVMSELENKCRIQQKVAIGHLRRTTLEYYYDIIGKTCDPKLSRYYAEIMSTYWSANCSKPDVIRNAAFDFVATPKTGCPILGYEFAKLIKKPFVLCEQDERFTCNNPDDMRTILDCSTILPKESIALIVDDSITGGSQIIHTIESLRHFGYKVHTCFVIFEVKVRDAKTSLNNNNVQLVSIVETHKQTK